MTHRRRARGLLGRGLLRRLGAPGPEAGREGAASGTGPARPADERSSTERLVADGYETVAFLGPEALAEARRIFADLALDDDHGFFVARRDHVGERAVQVDRRLRRIVEPLAAELFPGYRLVFATLCSKGPGSDSLVSYHQEPMFTDERSFRGLQVWCPLVDCDADTGVLKVVPGSHAWCGGIRAATDSWDAGKVEGLAEALEDLAVDAPLEAGRALVFDSATVHGSGPNPTEAPRPVVALLLVPEGAPLLIFHRDHDGELVGHEVDEAYFLEQDPGVAPVGAAVVEPWTQSLTMDDVGASLAARSGRRLPQPSA
jgi:hypothetical protein